jgi:hypothetical protein
MRLPILYVRLAFNGLPSIAGVRVDDGEEVEWTMGSENADNYSPQKLREVTGVDPTDG